MLTKRAPVGAVVMNQIPMATNQGFLNFRCGDRLVPEFLYYWLKANTPYLDAVANGSTYPELYASDLFEFEIFLPPVKEQAAIASVLSGYDEKLEINRRLSETLEATARAIYKDWFVDFGPVRAKIAGSPPYLTREIWSLFPDRLDSENKPEGWQKLELRAAADVLSGGTPSKSRSNYWNGSIPWISPKVMDRIHVSDSEDRVTPEAIGNGTRIASAHSVLLMVRGMGLHDGVRISQARRDVAFNQDVKALVPTRLSPAHLLFGMLNAAQYLFSRVESSGHGTGKLPTEAVDEIEFVTPPPATYTQLTNVLGDLNDRIAAAQSQNITLASIRDLLLPKLISGEVRLREAGAIIESAA